jgi:hypothetical protein
MIIVLMPAEEQIFFRNTKDYKNSTLSVMKPGDFLRSVGRREVLRRFDIQIIIQVFFLNLLYAKDPF